MKLSIPRSEVLKVYRSSTRARNPVKPGKGSNAQFRHERIKAPTLFDKASFRTAVVREHRVIVGCPKGKYNKRSGLCNVPMQVQAVLHPRKERNCPDHIEILKVKIPNGVNPSQRLLESHTEFNNRAPRNVRKFNLPVEPGDEFFEIGPVPQVNYMSHKEGKEVEYYHVFEAPVKMFASVNRRCLILVRTDGKPFDITDWFYH